MQQRDSKPAIGVNNIEDDLDSVISPRAKGETQMEDQNYTGNNNGIEENLPSANSFSSFSSLSAPHAESNNLLTLNVAETNLEEKAPVDNVEFYHQPFNTCSTNDDFGGDTSDQLLENESTFNQQQYHHQHQSVVSVTVVSSFRKKSSRSAKKVLQSTAAESAAESESLVPSSSRSSCCGRKPFNPSSFEIVLATKDNAKVLSNIKLRAGHQKDDECHIAAQKSLVGSTPQDKRIVAKAISSFVSKNFSAVQKTGNVVPLWKKRSRTDELNEQTEVSFSTVSDGVLKAEMKFEDLVQNGVLINKPGAKRIFDSRKSSVISQCLRIGGAEEIVKVDCSERYKKKKKKCRYDF